MCILQKLGGGREGWINLSLIVINVRNSNFAITSHAEKTTLFSFYPKLISFFGVKFTFYFCSFRVKTKLGMLTQNMRVWVAAMSNLNKS